MALGNTAGISGNLPSFEKVTAVTVASLPAVASVAIGTRAFVTDATANTFASTVVGGGAIKVPVYSTGAAWLVG